MAVTVIEIIIIYEWHRWLARYVAIQCVTIGHHSDIHVEMFRLTEQQQQLTVE